MRYKKYIIQGYCLFFCSILFGMHDMVNQASWLLTSQKNNKYKSLSILPKNTKVKETTNGSQPFHLPKETWHIIKKLMKFSYWKDEILYLESVSPVIIGNAELCTIDLWKMPSKDRRRLLNYHEKTIFDQKECDILKKIVPEKIKKDLVIHRLPLNDELYQDWAGIPGGRVQLRFLLSPIFG